MLKYPLPACTLTVKECKSIMWPALKSALPRSGITSYMDRVIMKVQDVYPYSTAKSPHVRHWLKNLFIVSRRQDFACLCALMI